jgi:hypothetical protein
MLPQQRACLLRILVQPLHFCQVQQAPGRWGREGRRGRLPERLAAAGGPGKLLLSCCCHSCKRVVCLGETHQRHL